MHLRREFLEIHLFCLFVFQEVPVKGRENVIIWGDIIVEITLDFLRSQIDLVLQEE